MKVTQITYEQLFPLKRPYANERLSVTVQLSPKESVQQAFARARATVVKNSTEYRERQTQLALEEREL